MLFLFDTSVVNRLHDDRDSEAIVVGLAATNTIRVSGLNVLEVARTPDRARRAALLRLLKLMTRDERPLEFPNALARRVMSAFAAQSPTLNCSIDGETGVLWDMLVDPELVDDEARAELDAWHGSLETEFRVGHERARPEFQRLFQGGVVAPRRAPALLRAYMARPAFLLDVVNPLYRRETGSDLSSNELEVLLRGSPEVSGFLLGWAHSVHQRALAREGFGAKNAGIVDLWFAAYLGRVDRFITNDEKQYRALRLIARIVAPGCEVMRYDRFRRRLIGRISP